MRFGIAKDRLAAVLGILVLLAAGTVVFSTGVIRGSASAWAADENPLTPANVVVKDVKTSPAEEKKTSEKTSAVASEIVSDEKNKNPDKKGSTSRGGREKTVDKENAVEKKNVDGGDGEKFDPKVNIPERGVGERGRDAEGPVPNESFLTWLYRSLGTRYIVIFLIITFNAVALLVMIVFGLRRKVICPDELTTAFEAKLNEKKYQEAYELAKENRSFLGKVLAAGMSRLPDGYEEAVKAMQEVGEEQTMKLEQRNGYIALIAQIGPMFGLLGTVDGMVMAFDVIAHSNVTPKPSELAQGIGTALVTTVVGLWIAIPCIAFYHIIRNRLSRLIGEVGAVSGNLMKRFAGVQIATKKIEK